MAQSHSQAQQRPQFPHQSQSFTPGFSQPNGRSQLSPQSPQHAMSYNSPSPQSQFAPSYSPQAPPSKRQRMSPDAPSPFSPSVQSPQAGSPVNGQMNGMPTINAIRPGLMPPPQQPVIKRDERENDNTAGRGRSVDFDQDVGALFSFVGLPNSQATTAVPEGSFDSNTQVASSAPMSSMPAPVVSEEDRVQRDHQRQDWDESRHAQHELWDPFLFIGTLNDKIKSTSLRTNLAEPQAGVLVNTQKNQPPPTVRVNGLEGATRVIRDGQSILDTREKADRLSELVKLISLSAKARMTNIIQAAARLAIERRQHSQGRVPDDWTDIAAKPKSAAENEEDVSSPAAASAGMKRTYSQANSEASLRNQARIPHPASAEFEKYSNKEVKAELARQTKKRRRTDVINAQENDAAATAQEEAITAAALEADKKTTKKERKMAESKISEQQQHASTNEAARMATASIFGSKKKQYSWMTGAGGGGGGGGGGALSRTPSAAATPRSTSVSAPVKDKAPQTRKGPQIGQFDENSEPGIQIRDLLLVLESDGRAARSFVRGSSVADDFIPRSGA